MSSIRATFPPSDISASLRTADLATTRELLKGTTVRMGEILLAKKIRLRVTLGSESIVIGDPAATHRRPTEFVFSSDKIFKKLFRSMRLSGFAMAYVNGDMKIVGPITQAVDLLDKVNVVTDRPQSAMEFLGSLLYRAAKVIVPAIGKRFESLGHYSKSAQAYELFLDRHMQYTCGRFEAGSENIEQAQIAKFQLIEKIANKQIGSLAGKDHLDIGSGWGGMVGYFQQHFGTHSLGNTNCIEQMEYAQRRYGCDIALGDFLSLRQSGRRFDLVTIVGMIEHLTPHRRAQLLNVVRHVLKQDGVLYLQCIVKPSVWIGGDIYRVAQREVFPGHYLETRQQTEERLKNSGFTMLEQFEHGHDYGLTTLRWVQKIHENEIPLTEILGPRHYRLYLGYLAFANNLFSSGRGSLMRYAVRKT